MSETDAVVRPVMLELGRGDTRAFRNNVGVLQDKHGNYVRFGLFPGSADVIGWKTVVVTPDMVGKRVAVFLSVECKKPKRSHTQENQRDWRNALDKAGGIALFARSAEQAREGVDNWKPQA